MRMGTDGVFVDRIDRYVPRPCGTALVSGMLETKERTDQFAFDVLHKHDCFEKIIAYSPSTSFARKRLLGRSARYSGLLDVLDFAEGSPEDLISADGPLKDVNSWLAFETNPSSVVANAKAAKDAGVKHFVMVTVGNVDYSAAEDILKDSEVTYTFITLGEIDEKSKEGGYFLISYNFTDASELGSVGRDDAVRVAAESFVIPAACNRNFGVKDGLKDDYAGALYVMEVFREQGITRQDEIAHLIDGGDKVVEIHQAEKEKRRAEIEEKRRKRKEEREKNKDNRPLEVIWAERRELNLCHMAKWRCIKNYERQLSWNLTGYIEDEQEYLDKYLNTTIAQIRPWVDYDNFNEVFLKSDFRGYRLDYENEQLDKELEYDEKMYGSGGADEPASTEGNSKKVPEATEESKRIAAEIMRIVREDRR